MSRHPVLVADVNCVWWGLRFYTLIPHDFGMKKPPLLDSEEIIKVVLLPSAMVSS